MNRTSRIVTRFRHSRIDALVLCSVVLALVGCADSNLPVTVPVSGTVTFNGGPCPAAGTIRFAPLAADPGLPRRPGRADFDVDGKYIARSFREDDGLVPGKYRVLIECWKTPPANGQAGSSYIQSGFEPPELSVTRSGDSVVYDINVPGVD